MGPCLGKALLFLSSLPLTSSIAEEWLGFPTGFSGRRMSSYISITPQGGEKKIRALCMHTPETWHSQESNIVSITAH